jgi:hypothetical protein
VPDGILKVAVKLPVTGWSTCSSVELSVPSWLQEPVWPRTATSRLGGEGVGGEPNIGGTRRFTTRSWTGSEMSFGSSRAPVTRKAPLSSQLTWPAMPS